MTRILTISELFWPEGGGAEYATYLILQFLAKYNHEITVLTGTKNPAKIPGVKYYITPLLKPANRITRWTLMKALATTPQFRQLLKRHDIVYIPLAAYPLIPYAKRAGLRVVLHLHNYMPVRYHGIKYYFEPDTVTPYEELRLSIMHEYYIHKSVGRALLTPLSYALYRYSRKWIAKADVIVCVSKRQAEIVTKTLPELRNKIKVIYNPPPQTLMLETPRKELNDIPTFLYMGGDSLIKGFYMVLRLISHLAKQNIKARFILANNYSVQNLRYIKAVVTKTQTVQVEVVGRLNNNELSKIWPRVWALLFPSISEEPLPYAVIEAALSATVPIAARVGGVPEILKETPAENYMFTPGHFKEFIKVIVLYISSSQSDIINMGIRIRQHILSLINGQNVEIIRIFIHD